jgi:uncharacterized protein (TIGR00369 family)
VSDADAAARVTAIFHAAPFIQNLGMELESVEEGVCIATLAIRPDHLQQTGTVHGAVIAALLDHAAGGAAASTLPATAFPLTTNLNVSLMSSARTARLRCVARVLKTGRTVVFAESEVHTYDEHPPRFVAKALVTLSVITVVAPSAGR